MPPRMWRFRGLRPSFCRSTARRRAWAVGCESRAEIGGAIGSEYRKVPQSTMAQFHRGNAKAQLALGVARGGYAAKWAWVTERRFERSDVARKTGRASVRPGTGPVAALAMAFELRDRVNSCGARATACESSLDKVKARGSGACRLAPRPFETTSDILDILNGVNFAAGRRLDTAASTRR